VDAITYKAVTASPAVDRGSLSPPVKLAIVAALAVNMHAIFFATVSGDMSRFLFPWFDHIVRHGPVGSFAHPFSDYTPPYLYLLAASSLAHGALSTTTIIKLLAIAGTGFLAAAFIDLLKAMGAQPRQAMYLLILPTVVINAAVLGQCDALWAGACIFAVAAMIRGRTAVSLAWCGVAIAFKAQAVFIAPFILGALIQRRAPLWQWAIPALVYAALMVPAWLAGWPAADLLTIYLRQAGEYDFAGRLANPWIWGNMFAHDSAKNLYAVGYFAAIAAAVGIGVLTYRSAGRRNTLLSLALLSSTALPFFLPRMHERYYFLADVLSLTLALTLKTRAAILAAVAIQVASLTSLISYAFFYNEPYPTLAGSFFAAAALIATWRIIGEDHDRSPAPNGVAVLA
jgi:Gpi18-like mannosyltransferase